MSDATSPKGMYRTKPAPDGLREVINPRRGAIRTVPFLSWKQYLASKDALFGAFGLEKYQGCATAEMYSRPVPHVFPVKETAALTSLYEERAPAVLAFLLARIQAPLQTLNKQSRLGWPWFDRPDSKRARLLPFFNKAMDGQLEEMMNGCFIIMNVRLQAEPSDKERDMLFCTDEGSVYSAKVDKERRTVTVGDLGRLTAARTRLVFNLPWPNLFKQVLDTAIHNVLLSFPVFHHNLYAKTGYIPVQPHYRALDVKHFERHTATLARARAKLLGGLYGRIAQIFADAPFLCPSDNWKKTFLLWPNRDAGFSDQYASGDSAVAPVQKEVFLILYSKFAETHLGVPPSESIKWVLAGGDTRLTIHNYGDDNLLSGDPGAVQAAFDFLAQYLHVEEEDPAKFLGFLLTPEGFRLGPSSYLLKTWLNERAPFSAFRKYPYLGWVAKRKIYDQYGTADIRNDIFPAEDKLLAAGGLPWSDVLTYSQREALSLASRTTAFRNPSWLLDKDYLMTAEEKVATGLFEGIYPAETKPMIRSLLDPQWHKLLQ